MIALARNGNGHRPPPAGLEVPTARDSAQAILAAVLVHPKCYAAWSDHASSAEFWDTKDRLLARAMEECRKAGTDPDFVSLRAELQRLVALGQGPQEWHDVAGAIDAYLAEVETAAVIFEPHYLAWHAGRVRDAHRRRQRALRLSELGRGALEDDDQVEHLERVARFVEDERKGQTQTNSHASALVTAEWARALPPPIATGLQPLDKAIGGLRAEGVYFLCGGTGKGKSGLAIQLSGHIARNAPIVYVTSELSRRQVIARFAAQRLNCAWLDLYQLPPEKSGIVADTINKHFPQLYVVRLQRDTDVVGEAMRIMDATGTPPLLVLDYIQHAARRLNPDDRRLATSALSDDLARYTTDTRGAALVLSSVARGFYQDNADKMATEFLGAAKESGDLEFDASGVFFLDTELEGDNGVRLARLHIAKSRFGGEGTTIGLRFDGRVGRFTEDPAGALTDDQREVLETIRAGAQTVDEVRIAVKMQKTRVGELIHVLASRKLVGLRPLRAL